MLQPISQKFKNNVDSSKKVFLLVNGCPENRIDIARIQEFLKRNGLEIIDNLPEADIIIFNSCALTNDLEDASIGLIKQIESLRKASSELIVCGCLPKVNRGRLNKVHQSCIFGHDETQWLNEIFKTKISFEEIHVNFLINETKFLKKYNWIFTNLRKKGMLMAMTYLMEKYRYRYNLIAGVCTPDIFCIKIATGCRCNCSFCSVRISRGKLKSKPIEKVVKEFDEGLQRGYREFALIGTSVGAYGQDQNLSLDALLEELIKRKGEYEIRLRNIQPKHLIETMPELLDIFKSGKISFLASAAESGNNRILQLMNRGYKIEDYKKAIGILNKRFPQIKIRTQFIVGFPTETNEEFHDSVRLLDELRFDFVEIYMFQPRPGTKAAKIEGRISQKIARKRYFKLLLKALVHEHRTRTFKKYLNKESFTT